MSRKSPIYLSMTFGQINLEKEIRSGFRKKIFGQNIWKYIIHNFCLHATIVREMFHS